MNENDQALVELLESCGLRLESRTRTAVTSRYQDTYNAVFRRA